MKVFTKFFPLSVAKKRGAMRVFRPTLCALLVFSSVLLFQCIDDENPDENPADVEVSITADKTTVTFTSQGGNDEVKITSSGDWEVQEEIAWLEATKVDNTLLQVTCEENTGASRSDKVIATIEEESVEITVTQSQPLGTLSTDTYTISSSEETDASLVLDLSFEEEAVEWWITGENGEAIPTFTSANPASGSRSAVDSNDDTFTYSIDTNSTGTAIPINLELHISGETGGASLTVIPFTVTQSQTLGTLSTDTYTISSSEETDASLVLDVSFETEATEWWITGGDGEAIPTFTSASPASGSRSAVDSNDDTFTYSIDANSTSAAIPISLEFHISGETGGASLTVIPFTVTQFKSLGALSTDTYTISSSEETDASLVLDLSFEEEAIEWWLTGENGEVIPAFTSASPSSDSKAEASSKTFTYSIGANSTGVAREIDLELHIASASDGASLTAIPFSVTQSNQLITALSPASFSVSEASVGSHTLTFTSLTLTGSATHWWLTGDASLPASVSLSPDKDDKKAQSTKTFTVTLPRNETAQARTYTLIFHAGGSATPSDPALDVRSFTVTQPTRLASVTSSALETYVSNEDTYEADLNSELGLTFETSASEWWITGKNGGPLPGGIDVTQDASGKQSKSINDKDIEFTLPICISTTKDCTYELEINIAASSGAAATDRVPFTITQSKALGNLGTRTYSLASSVASGETFTFMGLSFASEASEWWITGENGETITAPLSAVSPDAESKAALDQSNLPDSFTYSIGANTGASRKIPLEIQIAAVAGDPPLTTLPFILTQDGTTLGALTTVKDTISADGITDGIFAFTDLTFKDVAYWWVTGPNGGATTPFTDIVPDNMNRRAHDGAQSFIYTISANKTGSDKNIVLEIRIATAVNTEPIVVIPFTITQSKERIASVGSNDGIPSADPGTYTVTFSNRTFATGTTHWWVTGSSADRMLPEGVSVTADAESKALASATTFNITVPENLTTAPKTFTLLLHAGTSGLAAEPSLHAETFNVVQAGKFVTLRDDTYEIDAGAQARAAVNFSWQLSLRSDMTHWWITAANGDAASTIDGITSVSHDGSTGKRQAKGTNSFTIEVTQNPKFTDRDFRLALHVGTGTGDAEESVPFTVTQAGAAVTLSTANYDIPGAANSSVEVDFTGIAFRSDISHWWVTAANGDAANTIDGITSVSHDGSTVKRQVKGTNSFTIEVTQNPKVTDRVFNLALQVGESSVPFTVTQAGGVEVTLSTANYDIPAAANSSVEVDFTGIAFRSDISHWWITAANGDAANTIDGITSISHDGSTGKRQAKGTTSFTINVSQNPKVTDRVFALAVHVGGSSGNSQGSVPFTVTQIGSVEVTLSTTGYTIPGTANPSVEVDFTGIAFRSDMTHWWITAANGDAANTIDGITSVSYDGNPGKRQSKGTTSFTIHVSQNPTVADRDFMLALHVGGNTGNSQGSVPFTVTQEGRVKDGPIPINTLEQLNAMRLDLDGDGIADDSDDAAAYAAVFPGLLSTNEYTGYELARNLDFQNDEHYSDHTTNKVRFGGTSSAPGWTPIGTVTAAFTGTFDGGGHTITNLYINNSTLESARLGLFGTVNGVIRNVGIVNPNVTQNGNSALTGGLAGRQAGGTISACYVSGGTVTGVNANYVGGLVGWHNQCQLCFGRNGYRKC